MTKDELSIPRGEMAGVKRPDSQQKMVEGLLRESEHRRGKERRLQNREAAERLAVEMAIFAEIGRVIGSTLDIDEVYERFAAEAKKLIPFDRIVINLIDYDHQMVQVAHTSGMDLPGRRVGDFFPLKGTANEHIAQIRTGRIVQPQSAEEGMRCYPFLSRSLEAGLNSLLSVPLISQGKVIGGLHFRAKKPNAYTNQDLHLAERIGAQIAGAIANAQLFANLKKVEEEQRRNREIAEELTGEMAIIAEIGRVISSSLNIDDVYESFASQAQKLVLFDRLSVDLNNPDGATFTVSYVSGFDIPGRRPGDTVSMAGTISENIFLTRTGLLINTTNIEDITGRFPHLTNVITVRAGMRSLISVPLISRDEVIGTLHFRSKKRNAYTERDLLLAKRIGTQIAGAIANAQLYSGLKQAEEELKSHRKHLEDMVKERTAELEIKTITLQELNTTLRVLLKQREDDKNDLEERFVMNIRNLVLPFVEQMKRGRLDVGQQPCLEIIETHLHHIATPLLKNIRQFNLTPKEIKVATLVKQGKSTKEIAEILGIATGSVDIHRKNIRQKLGLVNRKTNLQLYLDTLG